jgi:hypothetical protein
MKKVAKQVKEMEVSVAEALGGRRTPFSGSGFVKGDGRVLGSRSGDTEPPGGSQGYRIECKWTKDSSFRLKSQDWVDLRRSAASAHEEPVFVIRTRAADFVWEWTCAVIRAPFAAKIGVLPEMKDPRKRPTLGYTINYSDKVTQFFLLEGEDRYAHLALVHFGDLADALRPKKAKARREPRR